MSLTHRIQETFIESSVDGCALHAEFHRPAENQPRPLATVILVHGLAEHIGRYKHICDDLVRRGYQVLAYDHRGHGRSSGTRGHVRSFDDYADDLETVIRQAQKDGLPIFILAQSLGAMIVLWYFAKRSRKNENLPVQAAALIGVPLKPQVVPSKLKQTVGLFIGKVLPKIPFANEVDARFLARDPRIGEAYMNDPLVTRTVTPAWFRSFLQVSEELPRSLANVTVPALFLHGGEDRIAHPDGSRVIFEAYGGELKQIHIYEGCYHELVNEECYVSILDDIHQWFQKSLKAGQKSRPLTIHQTSHP